MMMRMLTLVGAMVIAGTALATEPARPGKPLMPGVQKVGENKFVINRDAIPRSHSRDESHASIALAEDEADILAEVQVVEVNGTNLLVQRAISEADKKAMVTAFMVREVFSQKEVTAGVVFKGQHYFELSSSVPVDQSLVGKTVKLTLRRTVRGEAIITAIR